jgi:uncharacterized protein YndB with AHSA1/START domain
MDTTAMRTTSGTVTRVTPDAVRLERMLPASVERVWDYLVDADLRSTWLAGGPIDLRPGGIVDLDFDHSRVTPDAQPASSGFEPHHEPGTVVDCDPPHLLSYTWGELWGLSALVTFELTAEGDGTRLVILHSQVSELSIIPDVATGWSGHLDALEDKLRGGDGTGFWSNFDALHDKYATEWAS